MADGAEVSPGIGLVVATDEIGGVHYQRVKLTFGADGAAADVSSAAPLPTTDASSQALLTTIKTLLEGEIKVKDAAGPLTIDGAVTITSGTVTATISGEPTIKKIAEALPAGTNNIGQVDPRGNIAHDGVDSGNPIKVGGRAITAAPTAVAAADRTDSLMDKFGRSLSTPFPLDTRVTGRLTLTEAVSTAAIAAQGAGFLVVVTDIEVINAHASVATRVEILDGVTTKLIGYAEAKGGGFVLTNPFGIFLGTANTAVNVKCITTGAQVDVFIGGYKWA